MLCFLTLYKLTFHTSTCPSAVAKVGFISLIACPNDHLVPLRHIIAECRVANLETPQPTPQQDEGFPACMITRPLAPSLPMLLVCCYVTHTAVHTYTHTRLPYERYISCHEWFHKACQDSIDSVFKRETNFVCSECVQMFHAEQFKHSSRKSVHVKSTNSTTKLIHTT